MQHEATYELLTLQSYEALGALGALAITTHIERHFALTDQANTFIADSRSVCVAAQVLQHLGWAAQWGLGIHHPAVFIELLLPFGPSGPLALRVMFNLAALVCQCQRGHELAPKHLGQRLHRKQVVGFACGSGPTPLSIERATRHHGVQMDMALQILRPCVQHQAESGGGVGGAHPFGIGGKRRKGLRRAGKQGVNHPAWVGTIVQLTQGSPEWLDYRRTMRNASETAAVLGVSPWCTPYQLWLQKTGRADTKANAAMQRGTDLEPAARAAYETETGTIMQPLVLQDGLYSASLDGMTLEGDLIVEIKCPFKGQDSELWK